MANSINIGKDLSNSSPSGGVDPVETFYFRGWPIRYRVAGAGPPVILLHNGGSSSVIWCELMPRLSGRYQLFAFDLLGYGASARPGRDYTLDCYIDFLAEFVEQQRLAPVSLVGNCMGSAISLGFAIRRPGDVRALVLINPLTVATFLAGILGLTLRLRRRAPRLSRQIYRLIERITLPAGLGPAILRCQIGERGKAQGVHRMPELIDNLASPGLIGSLLGVLDDLDSYGYFDRLEPNEDFPPFCTIWGLQNRILSPEAGRELSATLRPKRQEYLKGCGHLLMLERPEAVASIIEDFLAEGERVPASRRPEHDFIPR
jgi:pimeloyl-ACP methyl ester carboxylesterase